MARYRTTVRTPRSQADAFAFMADLRNFVDWDPGVRRVEQVVGDGAGPAGEFDVTIASAGPDMTLRYVTTEYDEPACVVVRATNRWFTSLDRVDVVADGDGSVVTYDAELTLNGPLGWFDPALRPVFDRIGRRADEGLQRALDGERVDVDA